MSSILRLAKLLILDPELLRRTGEVVSQWTTNVHGKYKQKWLFAMFSYFHFTIIFCEFTINYTTNPWYLKDLEPAEGDQRMIVYCFFQFKN